MNNYPGAGLGIGTAVVGGLLGQHYEASTTTLCKLFGFLLSPGGDPVGVPSTNISTTLAGVVTVPAWAGVQIDIAVAAAKASGGKIVGVQKLTTVSNEQGYFEAYVVQGLTVNVTCAAFGKMLTINTTGLTTKDLSTYF